MQELLSWVRKRLGDAHLVGLLLSLFSILLLVLLFGEALAPLIVAIVLAYVLDDVVELLQRCKLPRLAAIILVCAGSLLLVLFTLLAVLPLLTEQFGLLLGNLPKYAGALREQLQQLQHSYAGWLNPEYLQKALSDFTSKMQEWGGALFKMSVSSIPGVITLLVYAVMVPVLVFFLLKDKLLIIEWTQRFLPEERTLLTEVWHELDTQIGNYIRGKFWETFIVGVAMWLALAWMGSDYALLLAALTGISVWIPFVGAAVVTIPVVLLSFFQWGWSDATLYAVIAYGVVQGLDANVVIPWLFSEVVNLHPIAIIAAILLFGSIWGVIGVIVAIPLASLVNSVIKVIMERSAAEIGAA